MKIFRKFKAFIAGVIIIAFGISSIGYYNYYRTTHFSYNSAVALIQVANGNLVSPCQPIEGKLVIKQDTVILTLKHDSVADKTVVLSGSPIIKTKNGEIIVETIEGHRFALIQAPYVNSNAITEKLLILVELGSPTIILSSAKDCANITTYLNEQAKRHK